jgi:hypothetical protein
VEKNPSIFSGFWSALGYVPETEPVKRKKTVWRESAAAEELPPDTTEPWAIAPLAISIHYFWSGGKMQATLHIISTTSCFELWFQLGKIVP